MSAADGWELTVPADDADLLAELRRHGVTPGQRLRIVATVAPAAAPEPAKDNSSKRRTLGWVAMGETTKNISENVDEHLAGFGR